MCGEIQKWQVARTAYVRLTTSGATTKVILNNLYTNVEEVRLDEVLITGFNGGASGSCYLTVDGAGLNDASSNNESKRGSLIMVDVTNPHTVHQRPITLAYGQMSNINNFEITLTNPNGTTTTFTEAVFLFTFVCRKSQDQIKAYREMKALMNEYPPSILDGAPRNTWNPKN